MHSTLTEEQTLAIATLLKDRHISRGVGTLESQCSIAAINLALYNRLTEEIPQCMSKAIGDWIIQIQDAMPDELRNSDEWKALLLLAAGTGRDPEQELRRLSIIIDWMWSCLAQAQPFAYTGGFGPQWKTMCKERTPKAAKTASEAAWWSVAASREASRAASEAAVAASEASLAASSFWVASMYAGSAAARTASWMAEETTAARTARRMAKETTAARTARRMAKETTVDWDTIDPVGLLEQLIEA